MRSLCLSLAISFSLIGLLPVGATAQERGLAARVAQLEAQVEVLAAALQAAQEILQYVHVETGEINYLAGPHLIIEGANVHVRSGSGGTYDDCGQRDPDYPNCESLTGLGNLIVGYNEKLYPRPYPGRIDIRTGSHNLVVGLHHSYASFAGFVTGRSNFITGAYASITGGTDNRASGDYSSVCGGHANRASGLVASVSGGQRNEASSDFSSVSGGFRNVASGLASSVSGGEEREAPDDYSWAAGSLFEEN